MNHVRVAASAAILAAGAMAIRAQQDPSAPRPYTTVDAPVVALTHARVIDGTGAPAREDQTLVIRNGLIADVAASASLAPPAGAAVIDLTGKTVTPGLVMMHEHLYYPTVNGVYGQLGLSFVRLYLAGGVTTMRTAGNVNGFMDIALAKRIAAREVAGPTIDATGPYLNGPNTFLQLHSLTDAADARRQVSYWADMGATSFKAYMQITRAELKAAIDEAHERRFKVTGHLCSVTYSEAADLGIDNLEHGFFPATDFVADKKPDVCPAQSRGLEAVATVDERGPAFTALVKKLVDKHVALTSTLPVFETFQPGSPLPPGLEILAPQLKDAFMQAKERIDRNAQSIYRDLVPKGMRLERAFAKAGGLLTVGTDPTGSGGVIPGYANIRAVELLVDAGFTPLEAISIGTLNGATFLGRDQTIGTIASGKRADLVVVNGDPSQRISDLRNVETVFKDGIGFDSRKLRASVAGQVGLW